MNNRYDEILKSLDEKLVFKGKNKLESIKLINFEEAQKLDFWTSISDLEKRLCDTAGEFYSTNPWTMTNFSYKLPEKDQLSFVLVLNNQIIGFSVCYLVMEKWSHISRVGIDPNLWKNGLGEYLLSFQADFLSKRNIQLITIEVSIKNERAIHLYDKCGFYQLSEESLKEYVNFRKKNEMNYIGADKLQIVMAKSLLRDNNLEVTFYRGDN